MKVVKAKRRRMRFVDPAAARQASALAPDYREIHLAADSRVAELTNLILAAWDQHGKQLAADIVDGNLMEVLSISPRMGRVALADTVDGIDDIVAQIILQTTTEAATATTGTLSASMSLVSPEALRIAANIDMGRIIPLISSQQAIISMIASNLAGDATRSQVVQMIMRQLGNSPAILLGSFGLRSNALDAVFARVAGQLERWAVGKLSSSQVSASVGSYTKPPTFGSTGVDPRKVSHHLEIRDGKPELWTATSGSDRHQFPTGKVRLVTHRTVRPEMVGDASVEEWLSAETRGVYTVKSGRDTIGFVPFEDDVELIDGRRVVTGQRTTGQVSPTRHLGPWFKKQPNAKAWVGDLHRAAGRKALRTRAETIARTETMRAANGGARAAMDAAQSQGLLPINAHLEWIVTPDDRLCARCAAMDFQTIPLLTGSFTEPAGGSSVRYPPVHPNCRCTLALAPGSVAKHGSHDQSSHGRKGGGGRGAATGDTRENFTGDSMTGDEFADWRAGGSARGATGSIETPWDAEWTGGGTSADIGFEGTKYQGSGGTFVEWESVSVNGSTYEMQTNSDAVPGGMTTRISLSSGGEIAGSITFQEITDSKWADDTLNIDYIEVAPGSRGKKVADGLLASAMIQNPGKSVNPGMLTDDGAAWWGRTGAAMTGETK